MSEPVQTDFGVHLIELKEVIATEFPSLDEMRAEIELDLKRSEAERLFIDRVRELDNLAFEQPEALEGISAALDLEIRSAEAISRSTGSGIFGNVTLRESLFTAEVLDQGFNSPAVEYLENRAVVSRVTARHEPETIPFESVAEEIRAELAGEQARLALESAHADALARVQADENVSVIANEFGLSWQTRELARRNEIGVPAEVLSAAFELSRPVDGKQVGSAQGADGTRYVITMTRVEDGDVSTMTEVGDPGHASVPGQSGGDHGFRRLLSGPGEGRLDQPPRSLVGAGRSVHIEQQRLPGLQIVLGVQLVPADDVVHAYVELGSNAGKRVASPYTVANLADLGFAAGADRHR